MPLLAPHQLPPPVTILPPEKPRPRRLLDQVSSALQIAFDNGDTLSIKRALVVDTADSMAGSRVYDTAYLAATLKVIGQEHGLSMLAEAKEKEIGDKIQWALRRRDDPEHGVFISRMSRLTALADGRLRAIGASQPEPAAEPAAELPAPPAALEFDANGVDDGDA